MNDKVIRLKYIRALEKFLTRCVAILKNDDFDKELFLNTVNKNYELIKNSKETRLDSTYLIKLKEFINLTLRLSLDIKGDFEEERNLLLKEANLLHKEKNRKNYRKDKHKNSKFNDGY